jgi:hypothetical protein
VEVQTIFNDQQQQPQPLQPKQAPQTQQQKRQQHVNCHQNNALDSWTEPVGKHSLQTIREQVLIIVYIGSKFQQENSGKVLSCMDIADKTTVKYWMYVSTDISWFD